MQMWMPWHSTWFVLFLLPAFKAANELVVKARKRADESAAFEDSINAATADGIDAGRDVD